MAEPLRIGIVGAGGMGGHHARELQKRPDARVVALCDVADQALTGAAAYFAERGEHPARYTDLAAMLAGEHLDGVVVATPHTRHAAHLSAALDAGCHVLCEKPMATTAADARAVTELAERRGRVLAIAYQRHGDPFYRRAHEIVASGVLGDIRLITVLIAQDCLANFLPGRTWRADPELSGGGHFMDTGSHIVDMLLFVSGLQPASVFANIDNYGTLVDVLTALSIRFEGGAVGTFAATSLSPEWREEFSFYGDRGVLNLRGEMTLHLKGSAPQAQSGTGPAVTPVANWIAAIRGEAPVQAPPLYGLRVAQISEAAYASQKSGRNEPVR